MGRMLAIITDSVRLGEALERSVRRSIGESVDVVRLTYDQCKRHPHILRESDYYVLELLRNYPGGMRVEGVTLAERLVQSGKRVLVVSCLSLGNVVATPVYWDVASDDSLDDRLEVLPDQDTATMSEGINLLKIAFAKFLAIPPQHME